MRYKDVRDAGMRPGMAPGFLSQETGLGGGVIYQLRKEKGTSGVGRGCLDQMLCFQVFK